MYCQAPTGVSEGNLCDWRPPIGTQSVLLNAGVRAKIWYVAFFDTEAKVFGQTRTPPTRKGGISISGFKSTRDIKLEMQNGPVILFGARQLNTLSFPQQEGIVILYHPPIYDPGGIKAEWAWVNPSEPSGVTYNCCPPGTFTYTDISILKEEIHRTALTHKAFIPTNMVLLL